MILKPTPAAVWAFARWEEDDACCFPAIGVHAGWRTFGISWISIWAALVRRSLPWRFSNLRRRWAAIGCCALAEYCKNAAALDKEGEDRACERNRLGKSMRDHREARARLLHQAIPKRIESRNNGMACGAAFCADTPKARVRCSDIGLPHTAWRKGGASCAHRQHRSSPAQTAQQEHCYSCRIRLAQAIHAQGLRKMVCGRSGGQSCTYA